MIEAVHLKLSDLTSQIQEVIKTAFGSKTYWIVAETSGVRYDSKKNYYQFDLIEKEENSDALLTSIKSSAFGYVVNNVRKFELATGQKFDSNIQVLAKVEVEYHQRWGLKLNLIDLDHSFTIGNLERQRQETLQKLLRENPDHIKLVDDDYITFNKKLSINPVIQNIALISSANAEGYKDFKKVLLDNQYGYHFNIDEYLSQVQGEKASQQMVESLITIYNSKVPYDAVIIVRGGGATTDFLPFDSYTLSKAVARFPIPIITGIGHTGNQCIVDRMAFKANIAPTKAGEYVIATNRLYEEKILNYQKSIAAKSNELLSENSLLLQELKSTIVLKTKDILSESSQALSNIKTAITTQTTDYINSNRNLVMSTLSNISQRSFNLISKNEFEIERNVFRASHATINFLNKNKNMLDSYVNLVRHLSPTNVLRRGYSLLYQNRKIITDPNSIKNGSEIVALLHNFQISSTVKDKKKSNGSEFKL